MLFGRGKLLYSTSWPEVRCLYKKLELPAVLSCITNLGGVSRLLSNIFLSFKMSILFLDL